MIWIIIGLILVNDRPLQSQIVNLGPIPPGNPARTVRIMPIGSLSPGNALNRSQTILVDHLALCRYAAGYTAAIKVIVTCTMLALNRLTASRKQ